MFVDYIKIRIKARKRWRPEQQVLEGKNMCQMVDQMEEMVEMVETSFL